ncbi:MAG: HD domain-containing phosphohydrolase [Planctomycetota bacterium]
MNPSHEIIPVDALPVGVQLSEPIYDANEVLLLGIGTRITRQVLQGLIDRGVDEVAVSTLDLQGKKRPASRRDVQSRAPKPKWADSTLPLLRFIEKCGDKPYSQEHRNRVRGVIDQTRDQLQDMDETVQGGYLPDVSDISFGLQQFIDAIVDDYDQTLASVHSEIRETGYNRSQRDMDRLMKLSMTAMAVGTQMEYDGRATLQLGLTALLSDIGRQIMGFPHASEMWESPDVDLWEYRKFPEIGVRALTQFPGVPAKVVGGVRHAYEAYDGTGFPAGLSGSRIHPYARILNVCRVFHTLISDEPQWNYHPHHAMSYLLFQSTKSRFESRVVKALLASNSLFPIGSKVRLGNGQEATVRRRGDTHLFDVVVETDRGEWLTCKAPERPWEAVKEEDGKVTIEGLIFEAEQRYRPMPREMMQSYHWNWFSSFESTALAPV